MRANGMIGVGILGSGFISDSYAEALEDVKTAQLRACFLAQPRARRGLRGQMGSRR